MHLLTFILVWFFCINVQSFTRKRATCNTTEIMWIPDKSDYFEEQVELQLTSRTGMNPDSMAKIVQEECKFEKNVSSVKRKKRFAIVKGAHFLYKFVKVISFVQLLRDLYRGRGLIKLYFELEKMNRDLEEEYFRTSIQILMSGEKIPKSILNHPKVLFVIKKRIPIENQYLLSHVSAADATCYQRKKRSRVVIVLNLKIPKVHQNRVKKCVSFNNGSLYHVSETESLRTLRVDIKKCFFENLTFCPHAAVREINCTDENLRAYKISVGRKA
ncbi:Signal peptide-containing protein [Caenorhabditis elegans]|uniref:Signal peptide-containing protein n=1 Tax=Caenorhabditis elegans TaxID=6239 RepID=Q18912_CAEEL|nr:Signal peptide-containing protein [Caenorhabditis elegans]CCD68280.2 Signal peptide-containing protein [Caenorhabditis elegans]|eukprot:NP_508279.3 Uncharacterized protein CELE_D1005.5 [Caenorhabditis elegans]